MDTLVFDIETQNFFTDPGVGWNNYTALKISVVGVYSYAQDKYLCFAENEMEQAMKLFAGADRIVGFSINRYDVPVLNNYFQKLPEALNLWQMERVDLLDLIEAATGERISLNRLAGANLGLSKNGTGAEAINLYNQGRMEELKKYCLMDVEITKKLYDLYLATQELLVPQKGSDEIKHVKLAQLQKNTPDVQPTLF